MTGWVRCSAAVIMMRFLRTWSRGCVLICMLSCQPTSSSLWALHDTTIIPIGQKPTSNYHCCCACIDLHLPLSISYLYHSLAAFFDRDNVALPGFSAYFKESR